MYTHIESQDVDIFVVLNVTFVSPDIIPLPSLPQAVKGSTPTAETVGMKMDQ